MINVALIRQRINGYNDSLLCARHNGLTAAACLARAGRGVLVLERADLVRNWEVTVGGMGTVTDALATDAVSAVATIVTDAEATAVDP